MKSFVATTIIRARPETIWAILTDAAGYPRWNSTVERIDGHIAAGATLTVYAKATPGRAFPLKVTEFEAARHMTWRGGMPLGLFNGTRRYTLTPLALDEIEFTMCESFGGLLAPLV